MAAPSPADLYEIAKSGARKLTSGERLTVLRHLEGPDGPNQRLSNYELGRYFQVDEKMVRMDKLRLVREYANLITPERAIAFVVDFMRAHDRLVDHAIKGIESSTIGTLIHQNYLKIASDLINRRLSKLQEIGVVPKELGHLNLTEERWVASFSDEGIASVRKLESVPEIKQLISGEPIDGETIDMPDDGL